MEPPFVLIIGCGISGPVLAQLLKAKGYNVIVFEKVSELGDAGASLMLMPNGLKVLDLISVATIVTTESSPISKFIDATSVGTVLGSSEIPSSFKEKYTQPMAGIKRTSINLMLKESLLEKGIDVRQGWKLLEIQENDESVTAYFDQDRSVTGSILIGCDGIKSATREALLRLRSWVEAPPSYTGLTQTAGISETPSSFSNVSAMRNWYGDGMHVICYPISVTHTSWAMTQRETQETEETWRPYRDDELHQQRDQLCSLLHDWDEAVLELIGSSERIIKFGLFDRQELQPNQWYSKRCVLVGDAAHPTSPHLGQGANQALEDCFHLSQALPDLTSHDGKEGFIASIGTDVLSNIFKQFAEKRQPTTSQLVRGARAQGEQRVATGTEACRSRDDAIVKKFAESDALGPAFDGLLQEPF